MHHPGDEVNGRYVLIRRLGVGGFGEVWLAHDDRLDNEVAIKFLHTRREDTTNVKRFEQEFRIARGFEHPNIARVFSHGVDRGIAFIVGEYIDGQSIKDRVDVDRELLRPGEAIGVARDMRSALAAVHAKKYAHRDV